MMSIQAAKSNVMIPSEPTVAGAAMVAEYAALRQRIAWLMRLKLSAEALIPLSAGIAMLLEPQANAYLAMVFRVGLLLVAFDAAFVLLHYWLARRSYDAAVIGTYASGVITTLIITVGLHLTGGFATPLVIFYLLNALTFAIVLQRTYTVSLMLSASAIMYAALAIIELNGFVPPIMWTEFGRGQAPLLPLVLIGFAVLSLVSGRLVDNLVEANRALARRSRQLESFNRIQSELYRSQADRVEQLRRLNTATRRIAALLDPKNLLQEATAIIHQELGYGRVTCAFLEDDDWAILGHASTEPLPLLERRQRYPKETGLIGWVIAHGQPVLVTHMDEDPRGIWPLAGLTSQSMVCVPLMVAGRPEGALLLDSAPPNVFNENDLLVMQSIATAVVGALDNSSKYYRATETSGMMQAIVRSVADGVLVTNPDDEIIMVSPQLCHWWGLAVPFVERRPLADVMRRLQGQVRVLSEHDTTNNQAQRATVEIRSPEYRIVEQATSPVFDDRGRLLCKVTVYHDITETRRTAELQENLMQMLVHDLRSPLNSVANTLEFLEMMYGVEEADVIQTAQTSLMRVMNLVNALLDVARLESGQMPVQKEAAAVAPLFHETIALMLPFANDRQVTLTQDVPEALPLAWLDRELMGRVLVNLVTNAIQNTPAKGQVTLLARVPEAHPDEIWLSVQDTGSGIRLEDQTRIFDKFVQVGIPRRRGSGLGLTFCRLATEAHGGRIWVESEEGAGSIFHVALPLGQPTGDAADDPLEPDAPDATDDNTDTPA